MEKATPPSTTGDLYELLLASDNPTEAASRLFDVDSYNEDARLRLMFRELTELGLIKVLWADSRPYHVTVYNKEASFFAGPAVVNYYDDHSVNIGAGVHMENSSISSFTNQAAEVDNKGKKELPVE